MNFQKRGEHFDQRSPSKSIKYAHPREHGEEDTWVAAALAAKAIRLATPDEYGKFVDGYYTAGGRISCIRPYVQRDSVLIALKPISVPKLFGSNSIRLLIPKGIPVARPSNGHSSFYCMENFSSSDTVEIFSDTPVKNTELELVLQGCAAVDKAAKKLEELSRSQLAVACRDTLEAAVENLQEVQSRLLAREVRGLKS